MGGHRFAAPRSAASAPAGSLRSSSRPAASRLFAATALGVSLILGFLTPLGEATPALAVRMTEEIPETPEATSPEAPTDPAEPAPTDPLPEDPVPAEPVPMDPIETEPERSEPAESGLSAESEEAETLQSPQARSVTPFALGDTTTPHAYFALRQVGTPGGSGDDRGIFSAIIDKYVVNPTGPALMPQSGSHPTQSVSVPLEGDRQADSMPATAASGVTRYQYRVSQTGFNANSLGIAANGDAYFTTQFTEERRSQASVCDTFFLTCWSGWYWGSWSTWSAQSTRYTSVWKVNLEDGAVAQLMTRSTSYATDFTGGAVNTAGVYHVSYITSFTSPANSMRFFILRFTGTVLEAASTATTVANSQPNSATGFIGDIAFDGYNNLHVLVGGTSTSSRMARLTAAQVPPTGNANPTGIAVTSVAQTTPASGAEPAGIAFPFATSTVWQGANTHYLRSMTTLNTVTSTQTYSGFPGQRDLASIIQAPRFQLRLVVSGGLQKPSDRFRLSASPGATFTRDTPVSATDYLLADDWITVTQALSAINLTTTAFPFSVAAMPGTGTVMGDYAQAWSCVETTSGAAAGSGTSAAAGTVSVAVLGNPRMECTVTLTRSAPALVVSKKAYVGATELARDAVVAPGTVIQYRLTFDNFTGTAAATGIDYTDYLADILDDATVTTAPAVTPAGGISVANVGDDYRLTGSVAAGQTRTVTFSVTVKANATNAVARAAGSGPSATPVVKGYRLNNYLVKAGDPLPTADCAAPAPGAQPLCTTNPIRAWSVRKDSQPEDGAMIHSGGNIYYRVKVTNFSGEAITGVQIDDDMTQTLSAATWDPAAPPAVSVPFGISFYTPDDVLIPAGTIDWTLLPASGQPKPEFSGSDAFDPAFPGGLPFPGGNWTFETPAFDIPATISGQKVAYAIVGYAVQGGFVADPADPESVYVTGGSSLKALPNAAWVNTVQAGQASVGGNSLYPNRCSAAGAGIAPGDTGQDYDCKVWHSLGESYFHIWKKTADTSTGTDNNLLSSTFVLADTYDDAVAGIPSRWLCRTNNNPNAGGSYVPPGSDPLVSGSPDWGASSTTYGAIAAWNLANPGDQREQCGRFFMLATASEGQAAGSWRALDIRGGDTVGGGSSDPLPNWRTDSALNVSGDTSSGLHGTYWLVETVSPVEHELLAKPMKLWVAPNSPTPEGSGLAPGVPAWYDYQGRLSLPVVGEGEITLPGGGMAGSDIRKQCVSPYGVLPENHQPNCVMPTGWTMPVFDVPLRPLPFTGGAGTILLTAGGLALLLAVFGGVWWRRRRLHHHDALGAAPRPTRNHDDGGGAS